MLQPWRERAARRVLEARRVSFVDEGLFGADEGGPDEGDEDDSNDDSDDDEEEGTALEAVQRLDAEAASALSARLGSLPAFRSPLRHLDPSATAHPLSLNAAIPSNPFESFVIGKESSRTGRVWGLFHVPSILREGNTSEDTNICLVPSISVSGHPSIHPSLSKGIMSRASDDHLLTLK